MKKPEKLRRARSEDTVQGIRETRSKDLLVELRCSSEGRGQLDAAFKEAVGDNETVRHLIPGLRWRWRIWNPVLWLKTSRML